MAEDFSVLQKQLDTTIQLRKRHVRVVLGLGIVFAIWAGVATVVAVRALTRADRTAHEAKAIGLVAHHTAREAKAAAELAQHTAHTNCQANKRVAGIESGEARDSARQNKRLLPRANIPGITHVELVKLTNHAQTVKAHRVAVLDNIAHRACE